MSAPDSLRVLHGQFASDSEDVFWDILEVVKAESRLRLAFTRPRWRTHQEIAHEGTVLSFASRPVGDLFLFFGPGQGMLRYEQPNGERGKIVLDNTVWVYTPPTVKFNYGVTAGSHLHCTGFAVVAQP